MANAIPEKSRQQIDEFKAQENWGRREVDKNAKRVNVQSQFNYTTTDRFFRNDLVNA